MNNLKIFNNKEFGEIRTVEVNGKFYAVGVDVARALDYANPSKAVTDHCKGDFLSWEVSDSTGKMQKTRLIPEGDIYRLTIKASEQSQNKGIKEKASKFEKWIFDEVLPSIRKTGRYEMEDGKLPCPLHPSIASSLADLGRVTERIMKNQGSEPYQIAEVFKMECKQFGMRLPDYFVKVPECKQMKLWDIIEIKEDT